MKLRHEFVLFVISVSLTLILVVWLVSTYLEPDLSRWLGLD